MPSVRVRENEPFEAALRRFKRTIEKTGLLTELRAREFYEKPTSERQPVERLKRGESNRPFCFCDQAKGIRCHSKRALPTT